MSQRRNAMEYRYHHFHLICSNLEDTEKFFTGMLGAKLIERRRFGTADGATLNLNGTTISLRVKREDENIIGDSSQPRYGYDHLGLEVEDVDAAYRELKGKGITFTIPPTNVVNGRMAFLKGPDGITIELFQTFT
jgi:catechol 2,3-dioxygenase-like lactoylglutathione lyase family enzyme